MQFGRVVVAVGRQSKIDCNHLLVSRPPPQLTDLPGCEPSGSNCPFLVGKEELLDFHSDFQVGAGWERKGSGMLGESKSGSICLIFTRREDLV